MNTKELNEYIKNYLENDKSQRSIMLTAPWGSGKSYYIKNSLCEFLHENNLDYAIVSLYGVEDLKEINKQLFLEIKLQKTKKSHKFFGAFGKTLLSGAAIVGKTLLKKLANVDIDLSVKEPNYDKLYELLNLKNRLIIFEDLERTGIDIVEILGYVNNLVELDGVKVLLVANESEIFSKENTKEYLKIKEKTVSDTINFASDYYESIKGILEQFDNKYFKKMLEEKDKNGDLSLVRRIKQQMMEVGCFNYRSLLYACQKTEDMLKLLDGGKEYNIEFIENVFIGTVIYSVKLNNGNNDVWNEPSFISNQLGNYAYPLYRIMYDYIHIHAFNPKDFETLQNIFINTKDITKADESLNVIYHYYEMPDKEVESAIDEVCERLKNDKGIVHNEYVRIANYLISMKPILNYDKIDECLKYMLINIENAVEKGEEMQVYSSSGIQLLSQEEVDAFNKFKSDMVNIIENKKDKLKGFDYKPKSISNYYEWVVKSKNPFINENGFADKLDIEKTINMLKNSSAKHIEDFRGILQCIYMGISNIAEFMSNDIDNLTKLKSGVDEIITNPQDLDKIQIQQLKWLSNNIAEIIKKLKGGQVCQD